MKKAVSPMVQQEFENINPGLRHFSKFVCFSTLFLIFAGAMVKSTGSGLAVPDWPLSYGMFFPPMVGGVFYEHGHRMVASLVGFLTLVLTFWLWRVEQRRWVKVLGFCGLGAVILQGLLGGITVLYFLPTPISVMHGVLAQIFFIITIIIAYSQSNEYQRRQRNEDHASGNKNFLKFIFIWIVFIFIQLILGAVMRHTESGLAIPDFPKMGGQWIPTFNDAMIAVINDWRFENNFDPIVRVQVVYHFLHRLGAGAITLLFCLLNFLWMTKFRRNKLICPTMLWINFLFILQIFLGIMTVLTQKSPHMTSYHVVNGAALLGVSVLLLLRIAPVFCKEN